MKRSGFLALLGAVGLLPAALRPLEHPKVTVTYSQHHAIPTEPRVIDARKYMELVSDFHFGHEPDIACGDYAGMLKRWDVQQFTMLGDMIH